MSWRILSLVCLSTALAAPQVFAAELPAPDALGLIESLLDSCSKANPASAADYKKQREHLVQDVPDKDLAELRDSNEYKGAYKEISERFEEVSKDDAVQTCKVFLGTADTPAKDTLKDSQKDSQKDTHK